MKRDRQHKKIKRIFINQKLKSFAFLLSAALFLPVMSHAQLSGTYSICSSGCNYSSISSAVSDLSNHGVSGAVTFNIGAGSYNESVTINSITGASSGNTITFQGAGASSTKLYYADNYCLNLSGASYVNFKDMTFELQHSNLNYYNTYYNVYTSGDSYCSFDHCNFKCPSYNYNNSYYSYDYGLMLNNSLSCTVNKCEITGGGYGLYAYSYSTSSATGNLNVTGCNFSDNAYYGLLSYYYNYNSTINQKTNTYTGNTFEPSSSYSYSTALLTEFENGGVIANNLIKPGYQIGIYLYSPVSSGSGVVTKVYNNMISNFKYAGIYFYNYNYYYYYNTSANANILIAHNTCYADGNTTPFAGINIYDYNYYTSSSDKISVLSNICDLQASTGYYGGSNYAIYIYSYSTASFSDIDGNDLYCGGSYLANFSGNDYSSLSGYKSGLSSYSFESNATNVKPTFVSASDLHLSSSSSVPAGVYAGISTDFDGDTRSTTAPTAGADEKASCSLTANAGNNISICYGQSAKLGGTANASSTYSWTSNPSGFTSTDANPVVSPATTTTYTVTESQGACTSTASVTVTVNPLPDATVTTNGATTFCDGGSVTMSAASNASYAWSNANGPIIGANSQTYTASTSGTYFVTVTNASGCSSTSSGVSVTVNPNPVASASASPSTVYYGYTTAYNTSALSGSSDISGSSYSWSSSPSGFSGSSSSESVTPSATTTYYLTVTSPAGCTSQAASVKVNVIDVRCGNNNDKVMICHNCNTICIAKSAVASHLANHSGDHLGECGACATLPEGLLENNINVYPNPFNSTANVQLTFAKDQQVVAELLSIDGRRISTLFEGNVSAHSQYNFVIDGSVLTPGMYLVKVQSGDQVEFRKIELMR